MRPPRLTTRRLMALVVVTALVLVVVRLVWSFGPFSFTFGTDTAAVRIL